MPLNKRVLFFVSIIIAIGYVFLSKEPVKRLLRETQEDGLYRERPSFLKKHCHAYNTSIFYIKVQKTGSSSIKSMLLNYALKREMRICLDNTDLYHMNFPYDIDESKLTKPRGVKCEMIADELIFNKKKGIRISILMLTE